MAQFAGIELNNLDPRSLQPAQLQIIRDRFLVHYAGVEEYAQGQDYKLAVLKGLDNYKKLMNLPDCDLNQALAFMMHFMPQGQNREIKLFKAALGKTSFADLDFATRLALIKNNKQSLNFMNDWQSSAARYYQDVVLYNLRDAYAALRQIQAIPNQYPVQILHYLEIINYLDRDFCEPQFANFRVAVIVSLDHSLKELNKTLSVKQKSSLALLFYCCSATKASAPHDNFVRSRYGIGIKNISA